MESSVSGEKKTILAGARAHTTPELVICEFLESVKVMLNEWSAKNASRYVRWMRAMELVHVFLKRIAWQAQHTHTHFFSSGHGGTGRILDSDAGKVDEW